MTESGRDRIQLLLVGDDGAGLRGIELLLIAHDLCVSTTANDVAGAVRTAEKGVFRVALVDLAIADSALAVVHALREAAPRLPVLGFGGRHAWPIQELLDAGMRGFALTTSDTADFIAAVRTVASGASYLDPAFAIAPRGGSQRQGRMVLTDRERQILGLLAHGLNGREIAARLFLSPATVRTHVQNAMHKLGARTRAQAIAIATGDDDYQTADAA